MVERHWDLEPDKRRSGVAVPPPYMLFSVEGPMTDDRAWATAVRRARDNGLCVASGPTGPGRGRASVVL